MVRLPLGLFIAGATTIGVLIFAGERLAFEAQALLLRPEVQAYGSYPEPVVMIECDQPDCETGTISYEVLIDATGRPRALRFERALGERGNLVLEQPPRTRAARAALAARWPRSQSGRPIRAFQTVSIVPPERAPTRHVPFPDTAGQPVSITLERCSMSCTYYVVTLDSDGDVDFCGQGSVKAPGTHRSHISRAAFEVLVQGFREADFFSLDDRYVANATDGPASYLRIRVGDREKTVVDFYGRQTGMPAVVTKLQDAVEEAAGTSRWIGSPHQWGSHGGEANCPGPLSEIRAARF